MDSPNATGAAVENTVDDIVIVTPMRTVTIVVNSIFLNDVFISRWDTMKLQFILIRGLQ